MKNRWLFHGCFFGLTALALVLYAALGEGLASNGFIATSNAQGTFFFVGIPWAAFALLSTLTLLGTMAIRIRGAAAAVVAAYAAALLVGGVAVFVFLLVKTG